MIFKIKFIRKTLLPRSDGPVIIHLTGCFGCNFFFKIHLLKYIS